MRTEICESIYRIGAVDRLCREFHGYSVRSGVTYNSYLVRGTDKTAIIDGVKAGFVAEQLANLRACGVEPAQVDFVIVNHAEADHASGLPQLMAACERAELVCDAKCEKTLRGYYTDAAMTWKFRIIKEGDSVSLGDLTLTFVETPMAHWPESMATYVPERKLLFSMDAFGQHYLTYELTDENVPLNNVLAELRHYYANILQPLGATTKAAVKKIQNIDVDYICPSHGIIWHKHINAAIDAYKKWTAGITDRKTVVLYDTMWNSTEMMAEAVARGASEVDGMNVCLFHVRHTPTSDIMDELLEAGALAFGSPTQNTLYMPEVGAVLTDIRGLRPAIKHAFVFGSCGWTPTGQALLQDTLAAMCYKMLTEKPLTCNWRPSPEVLQSCRDAGHQLAQQLDK